VFYDVLPESVAIETAALTMKLGRRGHTDVIAVEMYFLADNMFRMKIKPTEAARQRYEIPVGDVLVSQPAVQR